MSEEKISEKTVQVEGEWGLTQAGDRHRFLVDQLEQLTHGSEPCETIIDMSGVTVLDACGCQILDVFFRNLEQEGFAFLPQNIPDDIKVTLRHLGYADTFRLPPIKGGAA